MTTVKVSKAELDRYKIDQGRSILDLSQEHPVMLVFLRHLGCVFCREALRDISSQKQEIEGKGVKLVLIHMEADEVASGMLARYGLDEVWHLADPDCELYRQFGLTKGSISQLFGLRTLVRGVQQGVTFQQFGGSSLGDSFQMPGVFIIDKGHVVAEYIHRTVSDRPDYFDLAACCTI